MSPNATDFRQRYRVFLEAIICADRVWGLHSDEGWAQCEAEHFSGITVMPFWSNAESARRACEDDWRDYRPGEISLEAFIDDWLTGMDEDGIWLGIDWDENWHGLEIEALQVMDDLLEDE